MKELDDLLSQILGQQHEHAGESLGGPAWNDLAGSELDRIGLAEENGGAGGELADAVLVIARCAEAGLSAPLTETLLVAGACVSRSGLSLPAGRVSAVLPVARPLFARPRPALQASRAQGGWRLSGSAAAVAWGNDVDWLVAPVSLPDGGVAIAILARSDYTATPGTNLAGEPRDTVHVDGREVRADQLAPVAADALDDLLVRAALGRTAQLLGAIRACVGLTIGYAGLREQFGRPIGRQQAVRHAIVEMVGEAAATEAAVTSAREQLAGRRPGRPSRAPGWRWLSRGSRPPGPRRRFRPSRISCTARSASLRSTRCTTSPPGCGRGATSTGASTTGPRR